MLSTELCEQQHKVNQKTNTLLSTSRCIRPNPILNNDEILENVSISNSDNCTSTKFAHRKKKITIDRYYPHDPREIPKDRNLSYHELRIRLASSESRIMVLSSKIRTLRNRRKRMAKLYLQEYSENTKLLAKKEKLQVQLQRLKIVQSIASNRENISTEGNSELTHMATDEEPSQDVSPEEREEINWTKVNLLNKSRTVLLFDGLGHSYLQSSKNKNEWRCSQYKMPAQCKAKALEVANGFFLRRRHKCEPIPNQLLTVQFMENTKRNALKEKFEPSSRVVVIPHGEVIKDISFPDFPRVHSGRNKAVLTHKNMFPPNPESIFFDINLDFIPDKFFRQEIFVGNKTHAERHLIFGSDKQIEVLKNTQLWYIGRAWKPNVKPFMQLLTIQGFDCSIKNNPIKFKSFPLLFIFMSSDSVADYRGVFIKVRDIVGCDCLVEYVISDFNENIWCSVQEIFPSVELQGCAFNWFQLLLNRMRVLGVNSDFLANEDMHNLCKRVLALHLLPADKISKRFYALKSKLLNGAQDEQSRILSEFLNYVESSWIRHAFWSPDKWSAFGKRVLRTSWSDTWQRRISNCSKTPSPPNVYRVVTSLYMLVCYGLTIVPGLGYDETLELSLKTRNRKYPTLQSLIVELWESYTEGDFKSLKLLKECAEVYFKYNIYNSKHTSMESFEKLLERNFMPLNVMNQ